MKDANILFTIDLPEKNALSQIPVKGRKDPETKIEVLYFVDNPTSKEVIAFTKNVGEIVLWKDEAYDEIGDWTSSDAQERIKEIYS